MARSLVVAESQGTRVQGGVALEVRCMTKQIVAAEGGMDSDEMEWMLEALKDLEGLRHGIQEDLRVMRDVVVPEA